MENWGNIFLYSYEEEHISSLIFSDKTKGRHFHLTKCFIVSFCAMNGGGGFERFFWHIPKSWINVQQGDHATFLNLGITIRDKRDLFLFSTVRIPQIKSNIRQIMFCQQSRIRF